MQVLQVSEQMERSSNLDFLSPFNGVLSLLFLGAYIRIMDWVRPEIVRCRLRHFGTWWSG